MTARFQDDLKFAHETFDFLKKLLSSAENNEAFQPRGPKKFIDNEWEYLCDWKGDILKFEGREEILFNGEIVFAHDFRGGLIL